MKLYNDKELDALIKQPSPIITNWSYSGDAYAEDSPVQPASLDFHVGTILIPGEQKDVQPGGVVEHSEYCVPPGGTAVVVTKESLKLSSTVAGIVFPASSVAFRGIVITNPGHIDPGYEGTLRFTLVNVGKDPYALRQGCVLMTALLFEINKCEKNWTERRSPGLDSHKPGLKDIQPLSRDFLDVDKRAEDKAAVVLNKWEKRVTLISGIAGALIVAGASLWSIHLSNQWRDEIRPLKTDVDALKNQALFSSLTDRLERIEQRVRVLTNRPAQPAVLPSPNAALSSPGNAPATTTNASANNNLPNQK